MPFKSYRQQKFMFAKHPAIAKKWEDEYGALKKPRNYKPGDFIKGRKRIKKQK